MVKAGRQTIPDLGCYRGKATLAELGKVARLNEPHWCWPNEDQSDCYWLQSVTQCQRDDGHQPHASRGAPCDAKIDGQRHIISYYADISVGSVQKHHEGFMMCGYLLTSSQRRHVRHCDAGGDVGGKLNIPVLC